jgi:hypothetical protein
VAPYQPETSAADRIAIFIFHDYQFSGCNPSNILASQGGSLIRRKTKEIRWQRSKQKGHQPVKLMEGGTVLRYPSSTSGVKPLHNR